MSTPYEALRLLTEKPKTKKKKESPEARHKRVFKTLKTL